MIRLGQFLKYAGIVETGGEARELIADGRVSVDGEVETRRGRQLREGMVVEVRVAEQVVREVVDLSDDVDVPW
ncbi:RNA-binding S4 domain-containing protein [Enemella sp. A6]|uniref:RNA-binding S4 domain-containing protein n=1 Tax=Enemella sp. A6 TaxID=3440152 RepID=UPI003EBCA1CA